MTGVCRVVCCGADPSATLWEALGVPLPAPDRTEIEQAVAAARAALREEQWAVAFAAGQALSLEEAISEALGEAGPVAH